MKKTCFMSLLLALLLTVMIMPGVSAANEKSSSLQFNEDGKFRIMQITDIQDNKELDERSVDLIDKALERLQPDLVVLTGDNTWEHTGTRKSTEQAIRNVCDILKKHNVAFAPVFGNHDGLNIHGRKFAMSVYATYDNCIGGYLDGHATYNLPIKSSDGKRTAYNIYMIDSGDNAVFGGYDSVRKTEIEWYETVSNALKEANGGNVVPSLLFQHIAVPEVYSELLQEVPEGTEGAVGGHEKSWSGKYYALKADRTTGKLEEGPCPPNLNTYNDQYASWVKQGDIVGAFFGHDHIDDFYGLTDDNIFMGFGRSAGFGESCYGNEDELLDRAVRVIDLDEKDLSTFKTNMYYYYELKDSAPLKETVDAYEGVGKVNPNSGKEPVSVPETSEDINVPSPSNRIDVKITAIAAACVVFVILVAVVCIIVHKKRKNK